MARTIAAMFDSLEDARSAEERLIEAGMTRNHVVIVSGETGEAERSTGGLLSPFQDVTLPEEDSSTFREGLRRGGYLVAARTDETDIADVVSILERSGAVDLAAREREWRGSGWAALGGTGAAAGGPARRDTSLGSARVRAYVIELDSSRR